MNGIRARSTTIQAPGGNVFSIINIGVPADHPLADPNSQAGPSGLQNVRVGGISMPAPQFVMMHTNPENLPADDRVPPEARRADALGTHIERIVNNLLEGFLDVFDNSTFRRMQADYGNVDPNQFFNNFNSNFASDDLFEMIRRMSEEEANRRKRKMKAQVKAVEALPIIEIQTKHCKKLPAGKMEPPCCTVCCDGIELSNKGMFMPCGHIYHPDCLKPWLLTNNTCPVCRYELPLEEPLDAEPKQV